MPPPSGPPGALSLFPKPPSRKTTPQPRAGTPQSSYQSRGASLENSPPKQGRRTPENLSDFIIDGSPPQQSKPQMSSHPSAESQAGSSLPAPGPAPQLPPRSNTATTSAETPPQEDSRRFRSSIAKPPLEDSPMPSGPEQSVGIRSIFPQYNHDLPLDRQQYFPTQTNPENIPRTVISRQSHVPQQIEGQVSPFGSPMRSPLSAGSARRWPRRQHEQPTLPSVSTTEELREFWKAANGWKASNMEGKTFCMKLTPEKDTPIYHLSSATQPLYHMRIDPTSASAYVTLSRHDPSKSCKERDPQGNNGRSSSTGILNAFREMEGKNWQEAMTTTLEEPSRRVPPNDGLVALLYPSSAAQVAVDRPQDTAAVEAAERECGRLVWDEDSQNYFLVHPALAAPFCITIERSPAWSRTEYTLEHLESPQHLGRLTRDGTGEGFLELDTLVAGRIESYYVLDVAVAALMLVAHMDEKHVIVESFEPPPPPPAPAHLRDSSRDGSGSRLGGILGSIGGGDDGRSSSPFDRIRNKSPSSNNNGGGDKKQKKTKKKPARIEQFELDLESQSGDSLSGGGGKKSSGSFFSIVKPGDNKSKQAKRERERDKLPLPLRWTVKLVGFGFKCIIWVLTLAFKALSAIVSGLAKCLTSEKL